MNAARAVLAGSPPAEEDRAEHRAGQVGATGDADVDRGELQGPARLQRPGERPGQGDDTRHWGPPWHGEGDRRVAAYFLSANRGKRSAAIDLATEEGAELVRQLARQSDVVVENFKVGGLKKFGLDAEALRAAKPELIVASITGFGQDGPHADRAGYDFMIQGMGGLMSITGLPDGDPGGGPMRVGVAVADLFTGLYTCVAILAALNRRNGAGRCPHRHGPARHAAGDARQPGLNALISVRTRRGRATPIPT